MMNISLAGLLGAILGTVIAGVAYHLFIGVLERHMRARGRLRTIEDYEGFDMKMSLVRRLVLTVDLFVFAAVGYWIGIRVWD